MNTMTSMQHTSHSISRFPNLAIKASAVSVGISLLGMSWNAHAVVRPGSPAPDFTLEAVSGEKISLKDLKGKTVVLEWLNYECPFSKMHYTSGNLPDLQEKYTGEEVVWLSVASSAPGKQGYFTASEYPAENKTYNSQSSYVLLDPTGQVARLYEAKTTPHMFVIDPAGNVQYNGAIDSIPSSRAATLATAEPWADNAVDAVLKQEPLDPAATPPYGCSIKFSDSVGYDK